MFRAFRPAAALILAALAAPAAHAQGVYKSVGPDGKVTYSDQPPAGATTRMDSSLAAPPPRTAPAPADAEPAAGPGAKKAIAAPPRAAETPAARALDPTLLAAIIGVMGYEDLVQRAEQICVRTLPTSMHRYGGAADGWKSRNGPTVAMAKRALTHLASPAERQAVESGVQGKNQGVLAQVESAPAASRITWCDRSFEEIAKGVMDVYNNPKFASPLAGQPASVR